MLEGISTTVLLIYVSLLVLALIALTLLVLLVHSGLFRSVSDVGTAKPPIGRAVIAYKFQTGPYGSSGQIFTEAAIIAPNNKALGIYYDDPDKVDSNETRYVVGSVISEDASSIDEDLVKKFTEKDYKILHLPEVTYAVQTKFPHITTLSILIAVHKAYPRLKSYIEEHKLCAYPFIELYDGKTIHFLAPLSKQDEFYVPECHQKTDYDQASFDGDGTMLNTSLSEAGESCGSHDFSQTLDEEDCDSLVPDVQKEHKASASTETPAEEEADVENNNDNNNSQNEEANEEAIPNDDEPAISNDDEPAIPNDDEPAIPNDDEPVSDDSSSSFEVLKTEPTE
uniref:Testis-expressed sequence 264 protein n=1 Tax=Arion vulgaris TaxID=1028688 RepID=A0A0B6YU68_9EUPU